MDALSRESGTQTNIVNNILGKIKYRTQDVREHFSEEP